MRRHNRLEIRQQRRSMSFACRVLSRVLVAGSWLSLSALRIAAELPPAVETALRQYEAAGQEAFFGRRTPRSDRSCVPPRPRGSVTGVNAESLARFSAAHGGIGTAYVHLMMDRKVDGPAAEFRWHQSALREWLMKKEAEQQAALRALARLAEAWKSASNEPPPAGAKTASSAWLASALEAYYASRKADDPVAASWAAEIEGALFALTDLHRWAAFLLQNQLYALSFQSQTGPLFEQMDGLYKAKLPYNPPQHIGRFPAGEMTVHHADNYLEVERQAERYWAPPADWPTIAQQPWPAALRVISPSARAEARDTIESAPPALRPLLVKALNAPFERSFLENQIERARLGGAADDFRRVLRQARLGSNARIEDVMDLMVYRAGGWFCGLEWADRYQPETWQAAARLPAGRVDALERTHAAVRAAADSYEGWRLTLREAIAKRAFDCIRTTDFMGAVYRNAGLPGFLMVRMSRGGSGHTIAAVRDERGRVMTLDGQVAKDKPEEWPDRFFKTGGNNDPYAVELLGRGLDSWIFLEGYLVYGPAAGTLVKAPVPYLEGCAEPYSGPARGARGLPTRRPPATPGPARRP